METFNDEQGAMMSIQRASNGTELCFGTFGNPDDPAMLLIQGLSAQMLGWDEKFCSLLADFGYFVIRFDNRDIGRSQRFPNSSYMLRDMADDAAGLLEALGIASAHVVGASMGGMIAQELAGAYPERVRSLGLLFTSANTSWVKSAATDRPFATPASTKAAAVELFVESERQCASTAYEQDIAGLRDLGSRMYDRDPSKDGVQRQGDAVFSSPDRTELVRAITCPTVILVGDADQMIDHHASQELHSLIQGSLFQVFPGMGHEIPEALWDEIANLIVSNAARAGLPALTTSHS